VLFTLFVSRVSLLRRLEAEDLVLELADGSGLGKAERLGGLLHGTDHGRRATDEDLDVGSRGREALLELIVSFTNLISVMRCNSLP